MKKTSILMMLCLMLIGQSNLFAQCGVADWELINHNLKGVSISKNSFSTTENVIFTLNTSYSFVANSTSSTYVRCNFNCSGTAGTPNTGSNPTIRYQIAKVSSVSYDVWKGFFANISDCNANMLSNGIIGNMVYNRAGSTNETLNLGQLAEGNYLIIGRTGSSTAHGRFVAIAGFSVSAPAPTITPSGCQTGVGCMEIIDLDKIPTSLPSEGGKFYFSVRNKNLSYTSMEWYIDPRVNNGVDRNIFNVSPQNGGILEGGKSASIELTLAPNNTASSRNISITVENWELAPSDPNKYQTFNFTQAAAPPQFTITTSSNSSSGGSTSGDGTFAQGTVITVRAIPNSGYRLKDITENGSVITTSSDYSFTVNSNRNFVANFELIPVPTGIVGLGVTPSSLQSSAKFRLAGSNSGWVSSMELAAGSYTFEFLMIDGVQPNNITYSVQANMSQVIPVTYVFPPSIGGNVPDPSNYPYANCSACDATCGVDALGFYKGQCVSYVSWYMNTLLGGTNTNPIFHNSMFGSSSNGTCSAGANQRLSNACRWANIFAAEGVRVDRMPRVHDILWFPPNAGSYSASLGHVEIVKSVSADGATIVTTGYNANSNCQFLERTLNVQTITNLGAKFIHYKEFYEGGSGSGGEITEFALVGEEKPVAPTQTTGTVSFSLKNIPLGVSNISLLSDLVYDNTKIRITAIRFALPNSGGVNLAANRFSFLTNNQMTDGVLMYVDYELLAGAIVGDIINIGLENSEFLDSEYNYLTPLLIPASIIIKNPQKKLTINIKNPFEQAFDAIVTVKNLNDEVVFTTVTTNGIFSKDLDVGQYKVLVSKETNSTPWGLMDLALVNQHNLSLRLLAPLARYAVQQINRSQQVGLYHFRALNDKVIGKPTPPSAYWGLVFISTQTPEWNYPLQDLTVDLTIDQTVNYWAARGGDADHSAFANGRQGREEIQEFILQYRQNNGIYEFFANENFAMEAILLEGAIVESKKLIWKPENQYLDKMAIADNQNFEAKEVLFTSKSAHLGGEIIFNNRSFKLRFEPYFEKLAIYPNPSTNGIFQVRGISKDAKIQVFDVLGKSLLEQKATPNLDLSKLNNGFYLIQILDNNQVFTEKVIINK